MQTAVDSRGFGELNTGSGTSAAGASHTVESPLQQTEKYLS